MLGLARSESPEERHALPSWSDIDFQPPERPFYRGTFAPPKSKYGRRKARLTLGMTRDLEARWLFVDDLESLVFPSEAGTVINSSNLM